MHKYMIVGAMDLEDQGENYILLVHHLCNQSLTMREFQNICLDYSRFANNYKSLLGYK